MCRALVGLWERCESEDEKLKEMGEGCFMSHKGERNRGEQSGKSAGCTTAYVWNERAGTGTMGQTLSDGGRIVDLSKAKL